MKASVVERFEGGSFVVVILANIFRERRIEGGVGGVQVSRNDGVSSGEESSQIRRGGQMTIRIFQPGRR